MLTIGARGQIFLVAGVTDMRKAFNTLAAVVRNQLHRDPLTGDLFVFCNRRKDRIKILVFERGGFWLCAKRLEVGTFAWPQVPTPDHELSVEELTLLLGGIDLRAAVPRRWYRVAQQSVAGLQALWLGGRRPLSSPSIPPGRQHLRSRSPAAFRSRRSDHVRFTPLSGRRNTRRFRRAGHMSF